MIFKIKQEKIIIRTPAKSACSTCKTYIKDFLISCGELGENAKTLNCHTPRLLPGIQERLVEDYHKNRGYNLYIIGRDPLNRFVSGMDEKFIKHYPNVNQNVIKNTKNNSIANFYLWFFDNISSDIKKLTYRHLIDFHCRNIEHSYEINPHFAPITDHVSKYFLDHCKVISVDDNLINNLNKIFKFNHVDFVRNKNKTINDATEFNSELFLQNAISDRRSKHHCEYLQTSVKNFFKNDYIFYNNAEYVK